MIDNFYRVENDFDIISIVNSDLDKIGLYKSKTVFLSGRFICEDFVVDETPKYCGIFDNNNLIVNEILSQFRKFIREFTEMYLFSEVDDPDNRIDFEFCVEIESDHDIDLKKTLVRSFIDFDEMIRFTNSFNKKDSWLKR